MVMPTNIRAIDLMMQIPTSGGRKRYEFLQPLLLDRESREKFDFPAEYMFKSVPSTPPARDGVRATLDEMDRVGIERAMIGVTLRRSAGDGGGRRAEMDSIDAEGNAENLRAVREHPDRFFASFEVNPNRGAEGGRDLVRAYEQFGIKAATAFPAGLSPQVPINDKKFYPIYANCVELNILICVCAGVPGPRVPMMAQDVALIDEVGRFFPELKFVTRHGCEPWTELAVKLMLKWPNLYYSTSAFAPKYYPKAIVDFANTRGKEKVLYAVYYPMRLSLERIFRQMPHVPFHDDVWPLFLRENARRVFDV